MVLENARIWYLERQNSISAMSHSRGSASFNGAQFLLRGPWKLSISPFKNDKAPPLLHAITNSGFTIVYDKNMILKEFNFEFSSFM